MVSEFPSALTPSLVLVFGALSSPSALTCRPPAGFSFPRSMAVSTKAKQKELGYTELMAQAWQMRLGLIQVGSCRPWR